MVPFMKNLELKGLEEKENSVTIRKAKFLDLKRVYSIYFEVFDDDPFQSLYNAPERKKTQMTTVGAIISRLVHIWSSRLTISFQNSSIIPLLQRRWDPIPLEIIANGEPIGCCFLVRLSKDAYELGIIGVLKPKRKTGVGASAVEAVKKYLKEKGASRIIVGSGPRRTGGFFMKCGFKLAFSEDTLSYNLTNNGSTV